VQDWEIEQILEEEEGLAYFDGGTFSRGPHWLLEEEEEALRPDDDDTVPQQKLDPQGAGMTSQSDEAAQVCPSPQLPLGTYGGTVESRKWERVGARMAASPQPSPQTPKDTFPLEQQHACQPAMSCSLQRPPLMHCLISQQATSASQWAGCDGRHTRHFRGSSD